jgi:molybdate transport system substrate-binding protein
LSAKTIGTSGEGSSGRFVAGLIERLGIAEQVRPKIRSGGPGVYARILARGDVDFVVSGLPPLLGTPNIQWLGYIPAEIQSWVVFSGALNAKLSADAAEPARALLRHLTSAEAVKLYQENGIDPVTP